LEITGTVSEIKELICEILYVGGADVAADIRDARHVCQEEGSAQEDVLSLPQESGQ
jgi:hypothetical protein